MSSWSSVQQCQGSRDSTRLRRRARPRRSRLERRRLQRLAPRQQQQQLEEACLERRRPRRRLVSEEGRRARAGGLGRPRLVAVGFSVALLRVRLRLHLRRHLALPLPRLELLRRVLRLRSRNLPRLLLRAEALLLLLLLLLCLDPPLVRRLLEVQMRNLRVLQRPLVLLLEVVLRVQEAFRGSEEARLGTRGLDLVVRNRPRPLLRRVQLRPRAHSQLHRLQVLYDNLILCSHRIFQNIIRT